jgi:hypothetical protein
MSFLGRFRDWLAGPPHVADGGDEGAAAALHEEFHTSDAAEADVRKMETTAGGAAMPGISGSDAAETVEADFSEEAAPPDLDP